MKMIKFLSKTQKVFLVLTVLVACAPIFAFAQTQAIISINPNLPGVQNVSTVGPCGWVANFYTFALIIAGILAFGAVVWGGVLYAISAGNASKQSEGRSWIWSALIGLWLLGGAYLILQTVNPALVKCSLPQLTSVNSSGSSGSSGTPGPRCQAPADGPCSTAEMQNTCFGANSQIAAGVCNVESNGHANAMGDKCDDGNKASIGLFQINLSANKISNPTTGQTLNCPSAFSNAYTGSNPHCTITNQSLYKQCVAAAENPATNFAEACSLSKGGTNWARWGPSTRQACGV